MNYSIQTWTETIADIEYDYAVLYMQDCQVEFKSLIKGLAFIKAKEYAKLLNLR